MRKLLPYLESVLRYFESAKWWHFWNPGSGGKGGLILGAIIFFVLLGVLK